MWERGIKPSVNAHNRLDSTASSRLNSISNLSYLDHQDSRMDSLSSCASSTSPLPAHYSNTSFFTPTPPTPSSTHSLLSPSSPFSMALPSSTPLNHSSASSQTPYMIPVLTPPPPGPMSSGISTRMQTTPSSHGLIRSHSSSSNVLLGESEPPSRSLAHSHHSVSSLSNNYRSQGTPTGGRGHTGGNTSGERKLKKPLTHKRSLSNPLTNIILNEEQEATPTNSVHSSSSPSSHHRTTNGSSLACYNYRSPSPPSRAGSQPSITSNSVGNSPQPNQRVRHPPMKHISSKNPSFSQSIPCDDFPSGADPSISGSESVLYRQNTWQHLEEENAPPRCNSMAGMSRPNYSQSSRPSLNHMDLTSSSMVNLPVGVYNGSTENLDEVDDCNLPSSGKSRSVPKLTLMTVSTDNDRGIPSASTPTSPRTPGTYTPTRHMRHAIMHRFTTKTYITPHLCDFCKKSVMIAVRCKDCKYKCHKSCAPKAPPSCGLPQELINYFRKHVALTSSMERLADQRVVDQAVQSPSERNVAHHKMNRSNTYDLDMRDPDFLIQNLASEPTNIHYSPILEGRRHAETINGIISHELSSQSSSTSLLEVPHTRIPGMYRSTSSTPSPSTSPPTSPSLTPSSPQSPNDYAYPHYSPQRTAERKHESNGFYSDSMKHCDESDEFYSESPYSSACSSINDISDHTRTNVDTPCGMRPGPQIILAKSLPDLLRISPTESDVENSCSKFLETSVVKKSEGLQRVNRRVSVDSHNFHGNKRESLQRTLSTADSKASTLVASVPTEEDDGDSDSYISSQDGETYRPGRSLQHRNSVVDEWSIPFEHIRLGDCIGRGRMSKVHKGNWHGEVAIKHFYMPGATRQQMLKFKEEVSVLKRTRHENLALFMGASLVPPNLAIVTIFCKGNTLYKCIHVWSEPFHQDKNINIAKQIALAMGYLHARSIVHKNLNTRNIFLEKDKVVITDTGLSSLSDNFWIDKHNYLVIRRNKLYYLAPELIKKLTHYPSENQAHSEETDVYAFGTVLYELMIRKFPFSFDHTGFSIPPSALINLIGSGRRPEIQSKEVPKRMQDLIYDCWHMYPNKRLPFKTIHEALIKLSRRKTPITRSPSFPISLSKSTEGLDFLKP